MPEYIYLLHPFREGYFENPTETERVVMEEQFQYLKEATDTGTVLLAGPCLDDTFGLVILHSENEDTARAFMLNDPSLQKNVMMAELHPFRVSLQGK